MKKYILTLCFAFLCLFQNSGSYAAEHINPVTRISEHLSDVQYKKTILKSADNPEYTLKNMKSVMGPSEIARFIKNNNTNPDIYNPKNEKFSANFHNHTLASDGQMTQEELLDRAKVIADKNKRIFYIATTDHNTTEGAKKVLDIIQKNPQKYKNIKVILGMEVFSTFENPEIVKSGIDIHLVAWGINPYDKELNEVFYKADPNDKWNYSYRTFQSAIDMMSKKGLIGIAHPARYVLKENLNVPFEGYYNNLFDTYKENNHNKVLYTEGYYQSYDKDTEFILVDLINEIADKKGIIKTGSTDSHGHSIERK